MLQANRDSHFREARKWDDAIREVESRHRLMPSPLPWGSLEPGRLEAVQAENAALRKENRDLRERIAELEDPWFRSLPAAEQVEWRIHRDLLRERAETRAAPAGGEEAAGGIQEI
jgi:hypothetical protein